MIEVEVAVGVGYEFIIVPSEKLKEITLKNTWLLVSMDDEVYPLYKGQTFEDSTKIDALIDATDYPKIYKIDQCFVR